ncbi:MAG: hypothetical protein WC343_03570, partial [Bacilli bacterium]
MSSNTGLEELKLYLASQQYSQDIFEYILSSFEALEDHYDEYHSLNPESIDKKTYINRYIESLKSIKKLTFLRNINDNKVFIGRMLPINKYKNEPIGYDKDDKGNIIVTREKPKYICSVGGSTDILNKEVVILFDDVFKSKATIAKGTFIHELTHIHQDGFDLPWFILNRRHFFKCLTEGNALREMRHVYPRHNPYYSIPFGYDETNDHFFITDHIDYNLYKYLYFKLETLLGADFMNTWATASNDDTYLYNIRKQLDGKYGYGTFAKLYKYMTLM